MSREWGAAGASARPGWASGAAGLCGAASSGQSGSRLPPSTLGAEEAGGRGQDAALAPRLGCPGSTCPPPRVPVLLRPRSLLPQCFRGTGSRRTWPSCVASLAWLVFQVHVRHACAGAASSLGRSPCVCTAHLPSTSSWGTRCLCRVGLLARCSWQWPPRRPCALEAVLLDRCPAARQQGASETVCWDRNSAGRW